MKWYEKVQKVLTAFLGVAEAAAPVAAEVAKMTGHDDVVGDINKAGKAAELASKVVDNAADRPE